MTKTEARKIERLERLLEAVARALQGETE